MATRRTHPSNSLLDHRTAYPDDPDPDGFRQVLGHFATGLAAVTGLDAGAPVGLLVNSFTSVSLTPPLVAFCVAHTSSSWPQVRAGGRLCISFLAADLREQARHLAGPGATRFRDLAWSPSPSGLPLPDGVLAWLECTVEAEHPAGDHVIVVARVHGLAWPPATRHTEPLVYYRSRYGRFTTD